MPLPLALKEAFTSAEFVMSKEGCLERALFGAVQGQKISQRPATAWTGFVPSSQVDCS